MAKVLIGADLGSYSFNKTAKTITFSGFKPTLEEVLLITDVTNGTIIYQFNDVTKGGTLSGQVLTLTYNTNTVSFADTDSLQIFYWNEQPQSSSIDDMSILFRTLLEAIQYPSYVNKSTQRVRVNIEELGPTLGVYETSGNITSFNGFPINNIIPSSSLTAWNETVRSKIT